MVTSVILVRHAASEGVMSKNDSEFGLTSAGESQARKTALFLKGVVFSRVFVSSMRRAKETAKVITNQEVVLCDELREFNKIVFEDQPEDTDMFNHDVERALNVKAFFEEVLRKHRDSKILIVSHGNVIRYLVCCSLKLKPHKAPNFFVDNSSITQLFFDGNELVSVGCVNSTAHLFLEEKN